MFNLGEITIKSFKSTSRHPRWWILSLTQVLGSAFFCPALLRPGLLTKFYLLFVVLVMLIFTSATLILWLEIEAEHFRQRQFSARSFFKILGQICAVVVGFGFVSLPLGAAFGKPVIFAILS